MDRGRHDWLRGLLAAGSRAAGGPSVRQFRSRSGRNRVRAVMKARIFDTTFIVIGSADCG